MIKKKKLLIGLIILLCISLMTGCSNQPFTSPDAECDKLSEEILGYLENDDTGGIKSILCSITKSSPTIDKEIQVACDFFEGKAKSHDKVGTSSQESDSNGQIEYLDVCPVIRNVETDEGKTYDIVIHAFLVHAEDKNKVGVYKIIIIDQEGAECVIGELIDA